MKRAAQTNDLEIPELRRDQLGVGQRGKYFEAFARESGVARPTAPPDHAQEPRSVPAARCTLPSMPEAAVATDPHAEEEIRPAAESDLVKAIAALGTASEVEIQARTLRSLPALRKGLESLERRGIVRRLPGYFGSGFGDAVELTPKGYKSAS